MERTSVRMVALATAALVLGCVEVEQEDAPPPLSEQVEDASEPSSG